MWFQVFKYCFLYIFLLGLDFYLLRYSSNHSSYRALRDYYFREAFRFSGFVLCYSVLYFLGVLFGNLLMLDSEIRFYIWVLFEFVSGLHLGFILGKMYLTYGSNRELIVKVFILYWLTGFSF